MNVADITITSLETITGFDIVTGNYKFTLDELQNTTIEQSQEKTDITGKQGRKLNSLKRNKGVKISGTNGMISAPVLELQTGGTFVNKATKVRWTDYLTVDSDAATTNYKAVGTAGAEIVNLYIKNANGTVGEELEQAASAASGKFAYAPGTKTLTFSGVEDGTEIVVFYDRQIQADVLDNQSGVYSGKCAMYIEAIGEDKCTNVYRIQFYIPKADFNGDFSFEMGDNQSVHSFDAESLAGSCTNAGSLWTYTIFGANSADVA